MIISCSSDFCNTFDFTNHIKANTYFKSLNETSIDVVLENWPGSFQTFGVTTTGLSDCRKMILNFFGSYFSRLPPKTITCRSFRYFVRFLYESSYAPKSVMEWLNILTKIFWSTLDSHTLLKQNQVRGNQATFITKELSSKFNYEQIIKNKFNNGHPERPS